MITVTQARSIARSALGTAGYENLMELARREPDVLAALVEYARGLTARHGEVRA